MNLPVAERLAYYTLARECSTLEFRALKLFDRLLASEPGDPNWRALNDELFAVEVELTSKRARAAAMTAKTRGERHLKLVR